MKKFLSLVLALIMTMSLVTVSAGAKDFTDDDKLNYEEAVAVMSEIGVIDGYPDGSFKPQGGLTRGAAAKIICNMVLGPTTAAALRADTAPFKDVAVDNQYAGYIAYCVQQGITSGYTDGTYRPAAPLTSFAFMKMLLGALGYDAETEGYVGGNCFIAVAKQAIGIGLNKGLEEDFDGGKLITREEAALFAFNTLQADMVEYDSKTNVTVGGAEVVIVGSDAKAMTWKNSATRKTNIKDDEYVQFAEQYFPKLVKQATTDAFERPAYTWTYNKVELGTYVDYSLLVERYKKGVSGQTVYDLLGSVAIKDNKLFSYVDGAEGSIVKNDLVRSNKDDLNGTGTGVLTEIFLDTDKGEITIASINTWLAQATSNYNEKTETVNLKVFKGTDGSKTAGYTTTWDTHILDVEDIPAIADLNKDDFALVTISKKENTTKGDVITLSDVEILSDVTVTKFSKKGNDDKTENADNLQGKFSSITTGGQKYSASAKAFYDASVLDEYDASLLTDSKYNVYLDQYGNAIGVDLSEGVKNYVFITGYDRSMSNLSIKTADAGAIFTDGTMEVIKVNITDTDDNITTFVAKNTRKNDYFKKADGSADTWTSNTTGRYNLNRWFTYTVDKNGVYTLNPVLNQMATKYADFANDYIINCNHVRLADVKGVSSKYAYGEDASTYITVDQGKVDTTQGSDWAITKVNGVYTGVQDVKLKVEAAKSDSASGAVTNHPVYTVFDGDNYVIASIVLGEAMGSTANYAYILSGAKSEGTDNDGNYYWEFEAVLEGEIKTLTIQSKFANTIKKLTPDTVQALTMDGDYVVDINDVDDAKYVKAAATHIDETVHEVYDVTHPDGTASNFQTIPTDASADTTTAKTYGTDLYLSGRTLYTGVTGDEGLTFVRDAKAVLIQTENKKSVEREYDSVAEALSAVVDCDTTTAGRQFRGRIVAVLNEDGVADWVVLISSTPVESGKTPDYGTNNGVTLTGLTVGAADNMPTVFLNSETDYTTGYTATVTVKTLSGALVYTVSGQAIVATTAPEYKVALSSYLGTGLTGEYIVSVSVVDTAAGNTVVASATDVLAVL